MLTGNDASETVPVLQGHGPVLKFSVLIANYLFVFLKVVLPVEEVILAVVIVLMVEVVIVLLVAAVVVVVVVRVEVVGLVVVGVLAAGQYWASAVLVLIQSKTLVTLAYTPGA